MTDTLISFYLPVVRGHIVNKYAWMETRGNCLITIEDLQQIAAIALVKLAAEWDETVAEHYPNEPQRREGHDPRFWGLLAKAIKFRVINYYKNVGRADDNENSWPSFDAPPPDGSTLNYAEAHTSIRQPESSPLWGLVNDTLIEYFQILSTREKVLIALRYFDELPFEQIADILSSQRGTCGAKVKEIGARWRAYARNQFVDQPAELAPHNPYRWEVPPGLIEYVETRHRKDLSEWLWFVTECFRADVGYLTAVLGEGRYVVPGSLAKLHVISPYVGSQIDSMRADGLTQQAVANMLGITKSQVSHYLSRRHAIA
jgi:DNA-directed RNA polymerase specialized sigma24 family protein